MPIDVKFTKSPGLIKELKVEFVRSNVTELPLTTIPLSVWGFPPWELFPYVCEVEALELELEL